MWNRQDLKAKGKIAFKANYWKCVLVALLATILSSTGSSAGGKSSLDNINGDNMTTQQQLSTIAALSVLLILAVLVVIAIDVFGVNPLKVGCDNFFLCNRRDSMTDLDALGRGFEKGYYMNIVKVCFMRDLYIFLWTLLFIIPGIIKTYDYRLVSYMLAEDPSLDYKDALAKSKEIMYGHRWNAFVLDISFIGWIILGLFTLGLLDLFYVNPYIQATNAELYVALVHPEESQTIAATPQPPQTVEFTTE